MSGQHVPPLRFAWATRFYDGVMRALFDEAALRGRLLEELAVGPGEHLLDLGCGTGELAILLKQTFGSAEVTGVDPDATALSIAAEKAVRRGVSVSLVRATVEELASRRESYDRIFSSLVFHHLPRRTKESTLRAARQVLRAGGTLHVLDWGPPSGAARGAAFAGVRLLDGWANTADNAAGRLPLLIEEAGFDQVRQAAAIDTLLGTVVYLHARSPGHAAA